MLAADFEFDENGRIVEYFAEGRLVHDVENQKLASDVEARSDWSESRILNELSRHGVRFRPDKQEEFSAKIKVSIREWEPMLGQLTFSSIEFQMPRWETPGQSLGGGDLHWVVVYQTSRGLQYILNLEPFGGSLTSLGVVRPR